ncbi:hypothetical protein ACIA8G_20290 [Lentzea sp. NPDC051213]|uniref:hypothetical protein n=1 Tax=Lentzea sp. NPDC051213 TaxID=3364126 RepID=UPI0037954D03
MDGEEFSFDDNGDLENPFLHRPCPLSALDGSWLLEFSPAVPTLVANAVRGPMRIEVGQASLRVSGDIYVRRLLRPIPGFPSDSDADLPQLTFPQPVSWFPQLPIGQYSWYFRSAGATYVDGTLKLKFVRHLWDSNVAQFVSTDTGELTLRCTRPLANLPRLHPVMTGHAVINGGLRMPIKATKTSARYRGCRIEADLMTGRKWPAAAASCAGVAATFEEVYRTAGWDVQVMVNDLDIPEDALLTVAELQTLISTHRQAAANANEWRLWMLAGSANARGSFGLMFDEDGTPREGVVGYADARFGDQDFVLPSARNQALDDVPFAFLRTLVHEAGHAFNLFHPKDDVHLNPIGTTIMNQTGDVMGFASPANPYPCNASLTFDQHNRNSLIHAPDPQVRPGWRLFGWGHGSASSGVPEPADVHGLVLAPDSPDLRLTLKLPADAHQGEYVVAEVEVTNIGDTARDVSAAMNLAQGDLRLLRVRPSQTVDQIHDIVLACGPREMVRLQPSESLTGRVQLLFTSVGYTFDELGSHDVYAEFDPGEGDRVVRSAPVRVHVRPPLTGQELACAHLTADNGVGRAVALGDFGQDFATGDRLAALAEQYPETDTGGAFALVMANSLARTHTDFSTADTRTASAGDAQRFLNLAARTRSAPELLALATTVACAVEIDAPVVGMALDAASADASEPEMAEAREIAADFCAPEAR